MRTLPGMVSSTVTSVVVVTSTGACDGGVSVCGGGGVVMTEGEEE